VELGIPVVEAPGGRNVLGLLGQRDDGELMICLNSRFASSLVGRPTLGHEGGHVLLGDPPGRHCRPQDWSQPYERWAWLASALLSVSDEEVAAVVRGRASLRELADHKILPLPFVRLGCAIPRAGIDARAALSLDDAVNWWGTYLAAVAQRTRAA
jgi:hypothetical protein